MHVISSSPASAPFVTERFTAVSVVVVDNGGGNGGRNQFSLDIKYRQQRHDTELSPAVKDMDRLKIVWHVLVDTAVGTDY